MVHLEKPDAAIFSAAAERNREPILEVLESALPAEGLVLEIACGNGMHSVFFAKRLPHVTWQPSDADAAGRRSAAAWAEREPSDNLRAPVELDVTSARWPVTRADAIFNANMIHISPWAATLGLLDGAARVLPEGAPLIIYGPYKEDGEHTGEGNVRFDASLRSRNPEWGIRDLGDVRAEAERRGLRFERLVRMPANNLTVVYRRVAAGGEGSSGA